MPPKDAGYVSCSGVRNWIAADMPVDYHAGDKRVHVGALWVCFQPAWCASEPGSANAELGWQMSGACSSDGGSCPATSPNPGTPCGTQDLVCPYGKLSCRCNNGGWACMATP